MTIGVTSKAAEVMTEETRSLRGACYCRAVAYTVEDAFEYALYCHCGECRRRTGAASKPFAGVRADALTVLSGHEAVLRFGDGDGYHASCGRCGSLLYSLVRDGAYVHVTLGTLIDPPTITPRAHIFVGSKAPWDVIRDDLPQFDAFPTE
jgi:hypothetical protein